MYLGCLDVAVGGEVPTAHEIHDVLAVLVRTGDPARTGGHARVDEVAHAARAVDAEHARPDVPLHEGRVLRKVLVVEGFHLGRRYLCLEALHVHLPVAGKAHGERLGGAVRVAEPHDHVLQRVAGDPVAVRAPQARLMVQQRHQRRDARRVRGVLHVSVRDTIGRCGPGGTNLHCLGIRCVAAHRVRAAHEGVLADLERREELLGGGTAHRAGDRRDDHVGQAETVEGPLVRLTVRVVTALEAFLIDVERVRVLHRELTAAQQAGTRPRLVPILRLDLVDRQRQVLVRRVQVLHEQREHLLMRGREQEVVTPTVLQPEEVVAVVRPAARGLVRLARQQCREVHLLETGAVHLLADDVLDVAVDGPPERQPGEPTGRGTPDVAAADEQAMARHLGVRRVLSKGPEEKGRHSLQHAARLPAHHRAAGKCR